MEILQGVLGGDFGVCVKVQGCLFDPSRVGNQVLVIHGNMAAIVRAAALALPSKLADEVLAGIVGGSM